MYTKPTVTTITGRDRGPVVTIMAGIHGDEGACVTALRMAMERFRITAGTVHFVVAHHEALHKNVRSIEKNLNRSMIRTDLCVSQEDFLAQDIMDVLDVSDALLDLHAFSDPAGTPFLIGQDDSYELASYFPMDVVVSGLNNLALGSTDGYMHEHGKPAVCVEVGPKGNARTCIENALVCIENFLVYHGAMQGLEDIQPREQIRLRAVEMYTKESIDFEFLLPVTNFAIIPAATPIARDGEKVVAYEDEIVIIFPHAEAKIGTEAFVVCEEVR